MAREALTPQECTGTALLNPIYTALSAVTGISFPWSDRTILAVINGSTASTATINFGFEVDGQTIDPPTEALPTSNTAPQFLGPFSSHYRQPDGNVYIDLSSVTGVTVAVLQLPGVS